MSKAHDAYLPLVGPALDVYGFAHGIPNACVSHHGGERADHFAMANRTVLNAFGPGLSVYAGQCAVADVKLTKSDLAHDAKKRWRAGRGLGSWRFYWLPEVEGMRPEFVDEDCWWGVLWLRESGAVELARPPRLIPENHVNWSAQHLLVWSMAVAKAADDVMLGSVREMGELAAGKPGAVARTLNDQIAAYVGEHGRVEPKYLPDELKGNRTPQKIADAMRGRPDVLVLNEGGRRVLVPEGGRR